MRSRVQVHLIPRSTAAIAPQLMYLLRQRHEASWQENFHLLLVLAYHLVRPTCLLSMN